MFNTNKLLFASAIALTVSACGGGGGGSNGGGGGVYSSSTGTAIDGYLIGSTVTCDENSDGLATEGEAYTITDAQGDFEFSPACADKPLLISGGMNKVSAGTSYPFLGQLKAPAGSTVVTPLTTLLVETGLDEATLVVMLGLPVGTSLTTTDPVAAAEADPGNIALLQTGIAVQQMINELAEVFGAAPGDTESFAAIFTVLADTLVAAQNASPSTPISLFSNTGGFDATILASTAATVNSTLPLAQQVGSGDLLTLTNAIQTQSTTLMAATYLGALENVAESVQDPEVLPVILTPAQQHYLYLNGDAFKINGGSIPFSTFTSTGANTSTLATISFDFELMGTPVVDQTVSMLLTLAEVGGIGRKVEIMISKVSIFKNASDELEVNIPASSDIFVYGLTKSGNAGKKVNVLIRNHGANVVTVNAATNEVTLDYDAIVQQMLANEQVIANNQETDLQTLLNLSGTFSTQLVVSNLNYRYADNTALPLLTKGINGAVNADNQPVPAITGYGLAGTLVISAP